MPSQIHVSRVTGYQSYQVTPGKERETHTHLHTNMHTFTCTHTYTHKHEHTYINAHTQIHTYNCIYTITINKKRGHSLRKEAGMGRLYREEREDEI